MTVSDHTASQLRRTTARTPTARTPTARTSGRPGADLPCRENDGELWFAELPADVERAKTLCQGCPLQTQCLDGALRRREPWGVWGGELLVQGTVVARKRPRGRPRKQPVAA